MRIVPLNTATTNLTVFVDAGYDLKKYLTSQLGFLITLMDDKGNSTIVHYGSVKSKCVRKSVLAAQLFAMTHEFDVSSTICLAVNDIFGRIVSMKFYTDSRSLFDCLTNINSTTEKRLLIDVRMLEQSYERRKTKKVVWIPASQNPADAFTKPITCNALCNVLKSNFIELTPNAWVERNNTSSLDPQLDGKNA